MVALDAPLAAPLTTVDAIPMDGVHIVVLHRPDADLCVKANRNYYNHCTTNPGPIKPTERSQLDVDPN